MTKFIRVGRLPMPHSFYAINLFGIVFSTETLDATARRHECIHTAQMRELAYVVFYVWYVAEWFCWLLKYRNGMTAYRKIRFEREAYSHERDPNYLAHRRPYHYSS